jgi:hypothetical protein
MTAVLQRIGGVALSMASEMTRVLIHIDVWADACDHDFYLADGESVA